MLMPAQCDLARPACSRCVRRQVVCVGAGTPRFRFKDESHKLALRRRKTKRKTTGRTTSTTMTTTMATTAMTTTTTTTTTAAAVDALLHAPPSNTQGATARQLVSILQVTTPGLDVFCYGPIMGDLPRRIGHHAALDAAITAFNSILACAPARQMTLAARSHYGIALRALQACIHDASAYTPDTLAAIHLIIVCNGWMRADSDRSINHGQGILHLMNRLVTTSPPDDFLLKAIVTGTGALIRESVFDPSIDVQPWIRRLASLSSRHDSPIAKAALNKFTAAGFPLRSSRYETLAQLPVLIRRPRSHASQIRSLYDDVRREYAEMAAYERQTFARRDADSPGTPGTPGTPVAFLSYVRARTIFQEAQCLVLALCIVFNALLGGQGGDAGLDAEREAFCAQAVLLARESRVGRPFGALQVPVLVVAAWLASGDEEQRRTLLALLDEYRGTFAMHHFRRQAANWVDAPERLRALEWFPRARPVVVVDEEEEEVEEEEEEEEEEEQEEQEERKDGDKSGSEGPAVSQHDNCERCCIL